ncbi:hypothetical protein O181_000112 [Austropuccinia psidii MF-1]|uniref:Uncharacterized protein n=1 Tax=Austropuccinia psidii MF-1 TaxID=1389203 RepID=A0A9Q3B873_9BASI|nr:hypothetical protein [Austropuccinia psidii MF-1]
MWTEDHQQKEQNPPEEAVLRTRSRLGEAEYEEGEKSDESELEAALEDDPEAPKARNLPLSDKPIVSQAESSFLKMMEKMTQLIGNTTQVVFTMNNSRGPVLNTPSMREPESFDSTQAHKLRRFIQSCQLIFHNESERFLSERRKVLY